MACQTVPELMEMLPDGEFDIAQITGIGIGSSVQGLQGRLRIILLDGSNQGSIKAFLLYLPVQPPGGQADQQKQEGKEEEEFAAMAHGSYGPIPLAQTAATGNRPTHKAAPEARPP